MIKLAGIFALFIVTILFADSSPTDFVIKIVAYKDNITNTFYTYY